MPITITSKNNEKTFFDKEIINIGTMPNCDFVINASSNIMITLQYNPQTNSCTLLNNFLSKEILFKGSPIGQTLQIENICKLLIANSD